MFKKHIILLNGAAGCGKDSIANEFIKFCKNSRGNSISKNVSRCAFADYIRNAAYAKFPHLDRYKYDEDKDKPICAGAITLREWMINFANNDMKARYGSNIFAKITCDMIENLFARGGNDTVDYVVVTDLGFIEELGEILDRFTSTDYEILLIRVYRNNKKNVDDARKYITDNDIFECGLEIKRPFNKLDIHNNSSILNAVAEIVAEMYENAEICEL